MATISLEVKIPNSVLPYPEGLWNRIKYLFWRAITPGFLFSQKTLLALRLLHHNGRQRFVLGHLASGRNVNDFIQYLHSRGFYNHFIAWHDDGQIVSVRKLENFEWQYHLRIFNDGEVRGHYEHTPESHPTRHIKESGLESRREDFLHLLGDWIVR